MDTSVKRLFPGEHVALMAIQRGKGESVERRSGGLERMRHRLAGRVMIGPDVFFSFFLLLFFSFIFFYCWEIAGKELSLQLQ